MQDFNGALDMNNGLGDGWRQDYAENALYLEWLMDNNYAIADASPETMGNFPRIIYTKYLGDDNKVIDFGKRISNEIIDFIIPKVLNDGETYQESPDGSISGFSDGNGLFGLGLFPSLGKWLKPLLTKFWWLVLVIAIFGILYLIKKISK